MSVDADWCLPGSFDNTAPSPPSHNGGDAVEIDPHSAEVRAIVSGGLNKLKEWLEERLHYQDKLLYHLINARAPLSTAKRKSMQKKKTAFATTKFDDGLAMMVNVLGSSAPPSSDEFISPRPGSGTNVGQGGQLVPQQGVSSAALLAGQYAPQRSQEEDAAAYAADQLENSSKTSSHQSRPPSSDSVVVQEPHALALPGVIDAEVESPLDSPKEPPQEMLTPTGLSLNEWRQKLLDLFDDLDLDGSGTIDRSELRTAFIEVGIPPIDALQTFLAADETNSDDIDRMEWLHFIEEASSGKDAGTFVEFAKRLIDAKDSGAYDIAANKRKSFCIIRHTSMYRMSWDLFMVLLLAYVSVALPFTFGFGSVDTIQSMDSICDAFFLIDIIFNFRTSYIDSDECLVVSGKRIAKHYGKTWFTLDLVSSVPWDSVSAGLLPGLQAARVLKIGKIAKVLKLLRVGKVLKGLAGSTLLERIEETLPPKFNQTGSKLLSLVFITTMLCHWLACFMSASDGQCIEDYLGPGEPKLRRYLAALYWAMSTLTTVGYGDLIPSSDKERMYAMVAMIVGGAFYGYIIGSMTSVITDMDIDARAFNERMEMLDAWLEFHDQIPMLLKRRIRRHYRRQLRERTSVDDVMVMKDLSPELRADAASFVIHIEVRRNPVFRDLPNSALGRLVEVLQISSCKKGELIVSQGDPGVAMSIIVQGNAVFRHGHQWIPSGASQKGGISKEQARLKNMTKLIEGDSFGEEIIFTLEETYRYTIVASSLVSMYILAEDSFKSRFKNLPDLHEIMLTNFLTSRK
jgi:hypothetical protein